MGAQAQEHERQAPAILDLIQAKDAAAILGVSRMTLWRWQRAGKIQPAAVIGGQAYYDPRALAPVRTPEQVLAQARTLARALVQALDALDSTSTLHKPVQARTVAHKPVHEHQEHATATSAPYKPTAPAAPTPTHTSPPAARRTVLATYDPDLD